MANAAPPESETTETMPRWATSLHRAAGAALPDAAPGRGVRLDRAIDGHKAMTGPFVLALMVVFGVFTPPAWVYLALHGSYGIAWVVKGRTFPDRRWRRRVPWRAVLAAWGFLSLYWIAPVILVLRAAGALEPGPLAPVPLPVLALAVAVYAVGLVLMIGADVQKNAILRAREGGGVPAAGGLIADGFYARVRHPNYLGEMLIYGSFALVVGHWLPWLILVGVWLLFFVPNMLAIDASLSRYPDYRAWKERTGLLLPRPRR